MRQYIGKRLLQFIPMMLVVTFITFSLMFLAKGDAVSAVYENTGMTVSEKTMAAERARLGLDQPFLVQYFRWLAGFLSGHMGVSYISGKDVFSTLMSKLPATLLLAAVSLLMTAVISFPLGVLSAVKQNKPVDQIIRVLTSLSNSLPNFFMAMLLMYIFSICIPIFPVISSDLSFKSIFLPAFTLAVAMSGRYIRQVRTLVLDELHKPYVIGARARGIHEKFILWNNVIRVTMPALITLMALSGGSLLGGTAIVENIFLWDGVGLLAMNAITMRDYPIILAYAVWMTFVYMLVNLVSDVLYHYIDPRIRVQEKGESGQSHYKKRYFDGSSNEGAVMAESGQEKTEIYPARFQIYRKKQHLRKRRHHPKRALTLSTILLALLILTALSARKLCPYDPYEQNLSIALEPPSPQHIFGTDSFGRDLFSRVLMGSRISIASALVLVLGKVLLGTIAGGAAGWRGGRADTVIMRITDAFLSFPEMVFALAAAGTLGGGTWNAVLAMLLIGWPKYARLSRSLVLTEKRKLYVDAERMSGRGGGYIFFHHILPNTGGSIMTAAASDVGASLMALAGLSFLGLGTAPPAAEWGSMMSSSRSLLQTAPWTIMAPGIGIFITVFIFQLFNDALRDWIDPETRHS